MAQAIVARENGDDYQRLVLWYYINKFICNNSDIENLFYEYDDVKGFDDIIIKYKKPIIVSGDRTTEKEYIQVKYHQHQSDFLTINNLMDPSFINSKTKSFLQKLYEAYLALGDDFKKCLFTLYTTYEIDQTDTLYSIIDNSSCMITIDKLFDNSIRTKRANDKKRMMKYLDINEAVLKILLSRVKFYKGSSFPILIDNLNIYFGANGLIGISLQTVSNKYIALAKSWLSGKKLVLTKEFILNECNAENLIYTGGEVNSRFAIKSFVNNTLYLEQNKIDTLDLSDAFDNGKFLKEEFDWEIVYRRIKEFCSSREFSSEIYSIHLECSLAIAFLVGRILNPKSGICAYPMQKTIDGIISWRSNHNEIGNSFEDSFTCEEYLYNEHGKDSVLIISITHNIESDVSEFIKDHDFNIKKIYHIKNNINGQNVIVNGLQSLYIAEYISNFMGSRKYSEKRVMTHLFISAPAALMFMIGKSSLNMGRVTIYEHDMKCIKDDIYTKSAVLPMKGE